MMVDWMRSCSPKEFLFIWVEHWRRAERLRDRVNLESCDGGSSRGESDCWRRRESDASRGLERKNSRGLRQGDSSADFARLKNLRGRMQDRGWGGKRMRARL